MAQTKIKLDCVPLGDGGYHLFCKVKTGGSTLRALIDTGASRSVLRSEAAAELGLKITSPEAEDSQTRGIGTELIEAKFARIKSLKLGVVNVKKLQVGILDLQHIHATYASLNIKGFQMIIGGDILHALGGIIDYRKQRMLLRKPI